MGCLEPRKLLDLEFRGWGTRKLKNCTYFFIKIITITLFFKSVINKIITVKAKPFFSIKGLVLTCLVLCLANLKLNNEAFSVFNKGSFKNQASFV